MLVTLSCGRNAWHGYQPPLVMMDLKRFESHISMVSGMYTSLHALHRLSHDPARRHAINNLDSSDDTTQYLHKAMCTRR